ncbi:hypothetical protein N0V93_003474 [Gnomoniopsis smithogilvyi]|uniref:ADP-ribosylation factor n=1 Tax=Gnomoniopsis smithogilvyi TaxID=1191159 RepID=A0A9W9CZW3_9PEZI|nr:hypothetical protein N0V93_003474 [Gnomoniopsis smithogilvyi]
MADTMASASTQPFAQDDVPKNAKEILTELSDKFHDFDDDELYEALMNDALNRKTANFAVRFGVNKSEIAIDLNEQDLGALLQVQADEKNDLTTWINIWSPDDNFEVVKTIARTYKFSTRLQGTIQGWDEARRQVAARLPKPKRAPNRFSRVGDTTSSRLRSRRPVTRQGDVEKGIVAIEKPHERTTPAAAAVQAFVGQIDEEDLDMYKLLQEQYNYTTIDHAPNFICVGANWLHHRPKQGKKSKQVQDIYEASEGLVPPKHWVWYILTNEGTVISIHENPNYVFPKKLDMTVEQWEAEELRNMRKNTRDLLHQLSKPGMKNYINRVSAQKGVRSDLLKTGHRGPLPTARSTALVSSVTVDVSANLFYYLFEDYTAATSILSLSDDVLDKLTHDVLQITDRRNKDKDNSKLIKLLYARSKDLRQLKHLFESYENLIKGIIALGTDLGNDEKELSALSSSTGNLSGAVGPARGVKLSQKAFDRFHRLSIRLRLLMLDTIDEYLEEKTSLSDTYFNLMSQKDSQATSKLNRSASLLAKLSVFFLPISFMTSYFSIQVPDLTDHYTGTTYWVSFAVVATMSFLSLFFFSRPLMVASDVLGEKIHNFQKSMGRAIVKLTASIRGRKTVEGQVEGVEGGDNDNNDDKGLDDEL